MEETMTVKEAARQWGITERRVTVLCNEGRIEGAHKTGRSWMIPTDTAKPADGRIKTGAYKKNKMPPDMPLPVGISEYRVVSSEYFYVDKTMMIKEFLDERPKVSLFTRPRRFGKTLNMDMLRIFFEKTNDDTSVYFRDKKIWQCGRKYCDQQGKYPVIFITFQDVRQDTWEETYDQISKILREEFERHSELTDSEHCSKCEKEYFADVRETRADSTDMMGSLEKLSKMLDEHYGIAPVILIDDYDVPIQQGYRKGFYDEVTHFMRTFFLGGLRENKHLSYGILSGILQIADIMSGLRCLTVNSILDNRYSEYFGFTPVEFKEAVGYFGVEEKCKEICAWYGGYRFGETEVYNPWSIVNYFRNHCQTKAFWQSAGSNEIISEVLENADEYIYERIHALLQGKSLLTYIDTGVIYPQIRDNPSSVYSFLLMTGYLKVVRADLSFSGEYMCEVSLPNREAAFIYNKEILKGQSDLISQAITISIQEALYSNDTSRLQKEMRRLLEHAVSSYHAAGKYFYYKLILGLCAIMDNRYDISLSQEMKDGRYDIRMFPKKESMSLILIGLKLAENFSGERLKKLSETVLAQIKNQKYDKDMEEKGIGTVFRYGVAFSGKQTEIAVG